MINQRREPSNAAAALNAIICGMPRQKPIVTSRERLLEALSLPSFGPATKAEEGFPLRVPESYLRRIRSGDAADPLLRQVLPVAEEDMPAAGYSRNPLRESQEPPGLLRKYRNRALLIAAANCPIHCRYCFRRHFPYRPDLNHEQALDAIGKDPDIHEIILSGGEPLTLGNSRLALLISRLAAMKHLRRLRIHSRMPVVQPERIDDGLLQALQGWRKPCTLVTHCNHPQEIDAAVVGGLRRLQGIGMALLNQAVLLRGVNDSLAVQRELWQKLFAAGVLPYYLHLPDKVQGTAHFAVSETRGRRIINGLRACLPGYLVPRLAREEPGASGKHILA